MSGPFPDEIYEPVFCFVKRYRFVIIFLIIFVIYCIFFLFYNENADKMEFEHENMVELQNRFLVSFVP